MRKLLLVVLALILVLPATSALAQGRGGGGHGGGGSHGGGWHGGGGWHRGGGFHGRFRGGVVYVSPYWGWGWGWGWAPYYYGAYYYGPRYGDGPAMNWAVVDTDVSPEEARVYLDGRYIGTADDFDGFPDYLYLHPGQYKLEFRLEGYEPQTVDVDARPGVKINLNNKLRKIPGAKQYGSYETPRPEGGVLRYWGKQRGVAQPYDGEGPPPYRDNDVQARPDREEAAPPPPHREGGSPGVRDDSWRQGAPEARPRQRARLLLTVQPGDAAVYLDDRFLGIAQEIGADEKGVPLAPGRHTIMVSRPGFRDRTVEVEVSAGESKTVEVSLNR